MTENNRVAVVWLSGSQDRCGWMPRGTAGAPLEPSGAPRSLQVVGGGCALRQEALT